MKTGKILKYMVSAALVSSSFIYTVSASASGDLNGDGSTNVMDYIHLKNIFLSESGADAYSDSADINGDGVLTVADLVCLRNILLSVTEEKPDKPASEYPIDESCILEPKETMHTGEGTFYGGGYVGGVAML